MCGPVQDGLYCESLWNPAKIWCSPNLLRFDPTWKEALASCNFGRYACVCAPGPCKATYGRLLPRWPVEALASFSCASLYTAFHTHNCVTRIFHTQLYHTQLFTYNFFNFSILHHLLCLSFLPRPATTFVSCWKKLTCGIIRSFNCGDSMRKCIYIYVCMYVPTYMHSTLNVRLYK